MTASRVDAVDFAGIVVTAGRAVALKSATSVSRTSRVACSPNVHNQQAMRQKAAISSSKAKAIAHRAAVAGAAAADVAVGRVLTRPSRRATQ